MFGYSFQWQSSYNINDVIIVHTPVGRRVRSLMQVLLLQRSLVGNAPCTLIETVKCDAEERSAIADLVETQHYFFPDCHPISEL